MSKVLIFLFMSTMFIGCGALRVNPKGCKTSALWGANPLSSREITSEEVLDAQKELVIKKKLTVLKDADIRLRDLLKEGGVDCGEIKKLRVQLSSSWFIFREIQLKLVKF